MRYSSAGFVSKEIEFWADGTVDGADSFDCNLSSSGTRPFVSSDSVFNTVSGK
jgi:hypothetical protein